MSHSFQRRQRYSPANASNRKDEKGTGTFISARFFHGTSDTMFIGTKKNVRVPFFRQTQSTANRLNS
jgi:hypothetical protein